MKRETTNTIRFMMEDLLPPIIRDSKPFKWLAMCFWGKHFHDLVGFRQNAPFLSDKDYHDIYMVHPRVQEGTDNSDGCVAQIISDVVGTSICDVGCGTGYLLKLIREKSAAPLTRLAGTDFILHKNADMTGLEFFETKVEKLPFKDKEFDTVTCTHLIEHILDHRAAIAELRRITAKRLIIVVPREREGKYSFNPHFHFFPYVHSFLRSMIPVPKKHECKGIGRDIYYREDME